MKRINTKDLIENDSHIEVLETPRFNDAAEAQAVRVQKLSDRRPKFRSFIGMPISPYWFLAIAIVATMFIGAVGGTVAGLRDNQEQQADSLPVFGIVTAEANADTGAETPASIATASKEFSATRNRDHRNRGFSYRQLPTRDLEFDDSDSARGQRAARKVGVITSQAILRIERRRRVSDTDN